MPQELTPEQRLTQIEKLLESAVKLSHSNTGKIDALTDRVDGLTEKVESNTRSIDRLTDRTDLLSVQMERAMEMFVESIGVVRIMQNNIQTMQNNIQTMQTEIRGLQVENRRMMDRLFGEGDFE